MVLFGELFFFLLKKDGKERPFPPPEWPNVRYSTGKFTGSTREHRDQASSLTYSTVFYCSEERTWERCRKWWVVGSLKKTVTPLPLACPNNDSSLRTLRLWTTLWKAQDCTSCVFQNNCHPCVMSHSLPHLTLTTSTSSPSPISSISPLFPILDLILWQSGGSTQIPHSTFCIRWALLRTTCLYFLTFKKLFQIPEIRYLQKHKHIRKSHVRANESDVHETDFSFTHIYRSWSYFSWCRFTHGWNCSSHSLGFRDWHTSFRSETKKWTQERTTEKAVSNRQVKHA